MDASKVTIGRNVRVDLVGYVQQVPAKVDTGADSSAIWASNIVVLPNGKLQFTLFDKDSPYYTGEIIETDQFGVVAVRSSTGHEQVRFRTALPVRLGGKRIKAMFNLSDRTKNKFPILIGRRTLSNKFIVDVALADDDIASFEKTEALSDEMARDPYAFYKKYYGKTL